MILQESNIANHYLFPSTLFVAKKPYQVTTVLGSCIAVCLYDSHNKVGGINHFMLPLWNGEGLATAKFGNIAMEKLIKEMLRNGAEMHHIVAKVFGGTNLSNFSTNIGLRNYEIARQLLQESRIPILTENVQGQQGRKIIFNTHTGIVKMKYIQSTKSSQIK